MNHKQYSKAYNESKRQLRDAIKQLQLQDPERFAELQARAKAELSEPPKPRVVTRYPFHPHKTDTDKVVLQFRAGRKHFFISTTDAFDDTHLYFELLHTPEDATKTLQERHPKFTERNEKVTKVEVCTCPLCADQQNEH